MSSYTVPIFDFDETLLSDRISIERLLLCVNQKIITRCSLAELGQAAVPDVKQLHQQSSSNTKPEYIIKHLCQAIGILTGALGSVFAIHLRSY